MSADLILVVMIALEKYVFTQAEKIQKYRKRMVYGLLVSGLQRRRWAYAHTLTCILLFVPYRPDH